MIAVDLVLLSALTLATVALQSDLGQALTAVQLVARWRAAVLSDPARAVKTYCGQQPPPGLPRGSCPDPQLLWRQGDAWVSPCERPHTAGPLAQRHYRILASCRLRLGPVKLPLPPLVVALKR